MATIYKDVEVEVDLSEFDSEDLIEEVVKRGVTSRLSRLAADQVIQDLYTAYTLGQQKILDQLLKDLFYNSIGRIA